MLFKIIQKKRIFLTCHIPYDKLIVNLLRFNVICNNLNRTIDNTSEGIKVSPNTEAVSYTHLIVYLVKV